VTEGLEVTRGNQNKEMEKALLEEKILIERLIKEKKDFEKTGQFSVLRGKVIPRSSLFTSPSPSSSFFSSKMPPSSSNAGKPTTNNDNDDDDDGNRSPSSWID
jgi:hypothetical protein